MNTINITRSPNFFHRIVIVVGFFAALISTALATLLVERLALRHIGGQTGDVCGAVQQIAEILCLVGLAILAN